MPARPPDLGPDPATAPGTPQGAGSVAPNGHVPPDDPLPGGRRLVPAGTLINNNYQIESLLGVGGMGEIYRAVNVFTGDPVAVKSILPDCAQDDEMIAMFRSEARVLVQLRHDAIVHYHNFVLDPGLGRYCLIMEFVAGPHLGERLAAGVPLPEDEAAFLLRRLAGGLAEVHASGIIHRDLSPENVILRHGRVAEAVMIDFGIARRADLADGLGGRFAGKFGYVAPEQLGHAGGRIGPQTDIYGLALLVAALVRGRPLPMGDTPATALAARRAIPPLEGVSHRLFPLLQFMLEPRPEDRPASMAQVVAMLDDPARLPAQYRLPLWDTAATGDAAGAPGRTGSESPFGPRSAAMDAPPAPPAAAAPTRRPGAGLAGAGLAAAAVAGLAVTLAAAGLWLRDRGAPVAPVPPPAAAPKLPAPDLTTRDGFLAAQPLGPCALAERIDRGPEAGLIALTGSPVPDATRLLTGYEAAFGTRPGTLSRPVAPGQCPLIDFARELSGRGAAPPEIAAVATAGAGGVEIRGTVSGLEGRAAWVMLVAPDGALYDLTGETRPAADGTLALALSIAGAEPGGGTGAGTGAGTERTAGDAPIPHPPMWQPMEEPAGASRPAEGDRDRSPPAAPGPGYVLAVVTSTQPLAAAAAVPPGAPAATVLPAVLAELQGDPAAAAVRLLPLQPAP